MYNPNLPQGVVSLRVKRFVKQGKIKVFSTVTFESEAHQWCDTWLRRCRTTDGIATSKEQQAGVCEALDINNKVLATYPLKSSGVSFLTSRLRAKTERIIRDPEP